MAEHRVIEQVLDCLDVLASRCSRDGRLEPGPARQALEFFRGFADRCHHGKEENQLFPALEAKGFPRDGGPTGVMRYEHEQGRAHIRAMDQAIDGAAAGDREAVGHFVTHARGYTELLRQHIAKEDHCLFSMANQALSAAEQTALLDAFEHVEHHDMGPGTHERFLKLADSLAAHCGITAVAKGQCSTCCGHSR
jgi:hemerythrin-like domain-containing protein